MARLIGMAAGADKKSLNSALSTYLDELTQLRYMPQKRAVARAAKQQEAELLAKVAGLSSSAK